MRELKYTEIRYSNERDAVKDLAQWFGFNRSLLIFRAVRKAKTFCDMDAIYAAISARGVRGYPVRALFARVLSKEVVARWIKAEAFSEEEIK